MWTYETGRTRSAYVQSPLYSDGLYTGETGVLSPPSLCVASSVLPLLPILLETTKEGGQSSLCGSGGGTGEAEVKTDFV